MSLKSPKRTGGALPVTWDGRVGADRDRDACFSHCLAFLLGLPTIEVPNFSKASWGEMLAVARAWCAERGLTLITVPSSYPLEQVREGLKTLNPGMPYILGGTSADDDPMHHAVVCCDGETLCSPGGYGIDKPCDDGNYWCVYVGRDVRRKQKSSPGIVRVEDLPPGAIF